MPRINLANLISKTASVEELHLTGGVNKPPTGRAWLVLSGQITHVTGTNTVIQGYKAEVANNAFWITQVDTALASGNYPLFNNDEEPKHSAFQIVIIPSGGAIRATGGTGHETRLQVIEFDME